MSQVMSQEMTLLRPRCQQWMLWARAHTSIFVWARAQTPIMEGLGPGPDDVWVFILYCAKFTLFFFSVFPPSHSLAGTVPWDDKTAGSASVSIRRMTTTSISTAQVGHCLTFQTLRSQQNVNIQSNH